MAEDQLRTIIDGIRTRLQADLEAQLGAVAGTHEEALAEARRAAEAAAEQRWAAKLDAARLELTDRMHSEVAAARSEVERTMVAESLRVRVEAEQAAAEAASQARRDLDEAVAAERERAEAAAAEALRSQVDQAVAAERERAQAAAAQTVRTQVNQAVAAERERAQAAAAATLRSEIDQALAAERARAQQTLEVERQRATSELSDARKALDAARDQAVRAVEDARAVAAAAGVAAPTSGTPDTAGLLAAVRAIDQAASLSEALAATVRGAAREAPRVVLFIVNGTQLQEWPVPGVPAVHIGSIASDGPGAGLLGEVLRRNEPMLSGRNGGPAAPSFAGLPADRVAVAVPFVLTGRAVAVLYADEGATGHPPAGWQETVQILGRHASAYVAYLTAMRSAQAVRAIDGAGGAANAPQDADEVQGARRYARLLVSEIKLYNEGAVRQGRDRRDLLVRLKPEIERARRLYDERVSPSVQARDTYFQQELVQTLADGDQSLLG